MIRPLGKAEHIQWVYENLSAMNFSVFAVLKHQLEMDRLHNALLKVCECHPILNAKIKTDSQGQPCFFSAKNKLPVPELIECSHAEYQLALHKALTKSFASGEHPLFRVYLFKRQDQNTFLLHIVFSHVIADGASGVEFLQQVLTCYQNDNIPDLQTRFPSPVESLTPKHSAAIDLGRFSFQTLREGLFQLKFGRPDRIKSIARFNVAPRKIRVFSFRLTPDQEDRIHRTCRLGGFTVQGALGAAQLYAIKKEMPNKTGDSFAIASAINTRSYLKAKPSDQVMAMYSTLALSLHSIKSEDRLSRAAAEISKSVRHKINSGDIHLLWKYFPSPKLYSKRNMQSALFIETILRLAPPMSILTNLGKLTNRNPEIAESLQFVVAPPRYEFLACSVISDQSGMHVNLTFNMQMISEAAALRIRDEMEILMS
jgi:NRPS condensation-like uncharacterized protein